MDRPLPQLPDGLQHTIKAAISAKRPVLHHLNADTSWLLQIPRPKQAFQSSGRYWFNLLIDPWLSGRQSDVASWFSTQFHAETPRYESIAAVESLARNVESISAGVGEAGTVNTSRTQRDGSAESYIDAVAISHEFTDHCHKNTLLELATHIPVFATTKAASLIASWDHFDLVEEVPPFPGSSSDWRGTAISPLPEWLGIARLVSRNDALYYHSALLIFCASSQEECHTAAPINGERQTEEPSGADVIIYTPHGVRAPDFGVLLDASPPLRTLAFLHGLHDVSLLAKQLNLGAKQAVQSQRLLKAKYWVTTHDAVKQGRGVVSWLLRRKQWTLEEVLRDERSKEDPTTRLKGENSESLSEVKCLELSNGESFALA